MGILDVVFRKAVELVAHDAEGFVIKGGLAKITIGDELSKTRARCG